MLFTDKELTDLGYEEPRTLPNGKKAALYRFLFTWAIITDFTSYGYQRRWCFKDYVTAKGELDDWDGEAALNDYTRYLGPRYEEGVINGE